MESIDALSIVQFEPIVTLFPIITFPICSMDIFSLAAKPNPLPPMIVPDLITQFFPIIALDMTQLFPIKVFSPIFTPLSILTLFSIITFLEIVQFSDMVT